MVEGGVILNIRGTSGSGKTYIVRQLLERFNGQPILDENGQVEAYHLDGGIYVIGSYEATCGGCDALKPKKGSLAKADSLVRKYAQLGNVVFEGLLVSHVKGRWYQMSRDFPGRFVWACPDTPLGECVRRTEERRAARGVTKPLNSKNTEIKWRDVKRHAEEAERAGEKVVWLDHKNPMPQILRLLEQRPQPERPRQFLDSYSLRPI